MDCSLSGSSVHGIFQARLLEWIAISFSRGSSRPRNWTQVSQIAGRRFTDWATRAEAWTQVNLSPEENWNYSPGLGQVYALCFWFFPNWAIYTDVWILWQVFLFVLIWLCWVLVVGSSSLTGDQPGPLALGTRSPNHWTTREVPWLVFFKSLS